MKCENCGKELLPGEKKCENCGKENKNYDIDHQKNDCSSDNSTIGWGILGFLIPIVGFILFLVWINNSPERSKASGIGALIGFVFWFAIRML